MRFPACYYMATGQESCDTQETCIEGSHDTERHRLKTDRLGDRKTRMRSNGNAST